MDNFRSVGNLWWTAQQCYSVTYNRDDFACGIFNYKHGLLWNTLLTMVQWIILFEYEAWKLSAFVLLHRNDSDIGGMGWVINGIILFCRCWRWVYPPCETLMTMALRTDLDVAQWRWLVFIEQVEPASITDRLRSSGINWSDCADRTFFPPLDTRGLDGVIAAMLLLK